MSFQTVHLCSANERTLAHTLPLPTADEQKELRVCLADEFARSYRAMYSNQRKQFFSIKLFDTVYVNHGLTVEQLDAKVTKLTQHLRQKGWILDSEYDGYSIVFKFYARKK